MVRPDVPSSPIEFSANIVLYSANLLYPREDRTNPSALLFECRTCAHSEPATTSCIFRNKLNDTVGETAGVIQDVGQDPTVGPPSFCLLCGDELVCSRCDRDMDTSVTEADSGYESEAEQSGTQKAGEVLQHKSMAEATMQKCT